MRKIGKYEELGNEENNNPEEVDDKNRGVHSRGKQLSYKEES